ncbi:MAG: LysE family transporter [Myxococcota bacterium]
MGAASADAIFAVVVGFGLAAVSSFLQTHATLLQIGGAVFLIAWGLRVAIARIEASDEEAKAGRLLVHYISTFLLTLLNPANLATFGLAATGLGLLNTEISSMSVSVLTAGVFVGSMVWWLILTALAVTLKRRFVGDLLPIVNRIAGIVIIGFGVALLLFDPAKLPGGASSKPMPPTQVTP